MGQKSILFKIFGVTCLSLAAFFVYQVANVRGFMNPTCNPPNCTGSLGGATSGNLGLGTTNPTGLLHIASTTATDVKMVIERASDVNKSAVLKFNTGAVSNWSIGLVSNTSGSKFGISTDNTLASSKFVIDPTGYIGIGLTNPAYTLDVTGDINYTGTLRQNGIAFSGSQWVTSSPNIYYTAGTVSVGLSGTDANYKIITSGGGIKAENTSASQPTGYFNNIGSGPSIVTGTGNVGIGTTAPAAKLDIASSYATGLRFNVTGFQTQNIQSRGTPDNVGFYHSNIEFGRDASTYSYGSYISLKTEGKASGTTDTSSERMRITSTGNVGIGTNSPDEKINVAGAIRTTSNATSWNTQLSGLVDYYANNMRIAATAPTASSNGIAFFTTNSGTTGQAMQILPSGNVGIGTTVPALRLQVANNGDISNLAAASIKTTGASTYGSMLYLDATSNTGGTNWSWASTGVSDAVGAGKLALYQAGASSPWRMVVDTGGNVGIGTTTPTAKLTIGGTAGVDGIKFPDNTIQTTAAGANSLAQGYTFVGNASNVAVATTTLYINTASRVGIGTITPTSKLHISDASSGPIISLSGSDANYRGVQTEDTAGTDKWFFGNNSNNNFVVRRSTTDDITVLNSNGNVGIGTVTPTRKLEVLSTTAGAAILANFQNSDNGATSYSEINLTSGITTPQQLRIGVTDDTYSGWTGGSFIYSTGASGRLALGAANAEKLTILPSGNVGIGTTAPVSKVQVLSDDTYAGGILLSPSTMAVGLDLWHNNSGFTNEYIDSRYDSASAAMNFRMRANGTPVNAMTILGSGNVGIGISNPSEKLTVYGANYTTAASRGQLFVHTSDAQAANIGGTVAMGGFATTGGTTPYVFGSISGRKLNSTTADYTGYLAFGAAYSSSEVQEHMRIVGGTGYVGIGTTNPVKKLDVVGSARVVNSSDTGAEVTGTGASNYAMVVTASNATNGYGLAVRAGNGTSNTLDIADFADRVGNSKVSIKNNGNVGIGTATPSGKLNMAYTVDTAPLTYTNGGNEGLVINATRSAAGTYYRGTVDFVAGRASDPTNGGSTFRFFTQPRTTGAPAEALTIQYNGTVGIGVTNPDSNYKLTTTAGGGKFENNDATNPAGYFDNLGVGPDLQVATGGIKFGDGTTQTTSGTGGWTSATGKIYTTTLTDSIGIGTTAPNNTLHLVGGTTIFNEGLRVERNTVPTQYGLYNYNAGELNIVAVNTAGTGTSVRFSRSDNGTATSESMRIDTNGNVGIGTVAPSTKLHVASAGTSVASILIDASADTDSRGAQVVYSAKNSGLTVGGWTTGLNVVSSENNFEFYNGAAYPFRIINSGSVNNTLVISGGNVGIGTAAPSEKLEVNGVVKATYFNANGLLIRGLVSNSPYTNSSWIQGAANSGTFITNSDITRWAGLKTDGSFDVNGGQLTVLATGNVGIGTTAPGALLALSGAVTTGITNAPTLINVLSTNLQAADMGGGIMLGGVYTGTSQTAFGYIGGLKENGTDNNYSGKLVFGARTNGGSGGDMTRMTILGSNGNVGIGTTAPTAKLQVTGGGIKVAGASEFYNTVGLFGAASQFYMGSSAGAGQFGAIVWNDTSKALEFTGTQGAGTVMTLKSGNVGIGTTNPVAKLHIEGPAGAPAAANSAFRIRTATNSLLDMGVYSGSPYASWIQATDSGSWGTANYNLLLNPQGGNVGIGLTSPDANYKLTTTAGGGKFENNDTTNPAGYFSNANATGKALWSTGTTTLATTGGNVGIGTTAPGAKLDVAGRIWQTGTGQSVFLGEGAGASDDLSNNWNVFVGYQAGYSNTIGALNTANGWQALYSNTTGSRNTASGLYALYSNTTSSFNTASGYQALSSSTGGNNTGFGNLAGNAITSGTNNTFLGSEAGYGASQLATAVNSMALGYGAVTTANNQVVIGNTSITQTLLNGNVGIGTTNPTAKLEVNGSVAVLGVPASKAFDTVYQATTDGIVTAYKNCIDGGYLEMQLEGLIGSVNPPTTRINFARMTYIPGNGSSRTINVTFPVKKGYYWKAQFNYTGTIGTCNFVEVYFTPIGVE